MIAVSTMVRPGDGPMVVRENGIWSRRRTGTERLARSGDATGRWRAPRTCEDFALDVADHAMASAPTRRRLESTKDGLGQGCRFQHFEHPQVRIFHPLAGYLIELCNLSAENVGLCLDR